MNPQGIVGSGLRKSHKEAAFPRRYPTYAGHARGLPDHKKCREAVGYTTGYASYPKADGVILLYDFSNFPTTKTLVVLHLNQKGNDDEINITFYLYNFNNQFGACGY